MINKKLLSICVPTYNRALKLKVSLLQILEQVSNLQDLVEVIVSDNASTDSTQEVLNDLKGKFPFLKTYKNDSNIGFTLNFLKLSDEYATGKFFWLIGDDDVIDSKSVGVVVKALQENLDVFFLGLNFRIGFSEHKSTEINDFDIDKTTMIELINVQCRAENLLATFISTNIILLDKFKAFDKLLFSGDSWNNYRNVFPHTHIISSVIKPLDKVLYIKKPLISVMVHEKEWDDKTALINLFYIIDVYKNFIHCGYDEKEMRNAKRVIMNAGFGDLFNSRIHFKYRWNFMKFCLSDFYFYLELLKKIKRKLFTK